VAALLKNTCLKFPSLHWSLSQWQEIKGGGGTGGKVLSVSKFYEKKIYWKNYTVILRNLSIGLNSGEAITKSVFTEIARFSPPPCTYTKTWRKNPTIHPTLLAKLRNGGGRGAYSPRQCKILIMLSNQPAHAYGTLGSVPLTPRCTGLLSKTCLPRLPKC
jgi:hypothetical protein